MPTEQQPFVPDPSKRAGDDRVRLNKPHRTSRARSRKLITRRLNKSLECFTPMIGEWLLSQLREIAGSTQPLTMSAEYLAFINDQWDRDAIEAIERSGVME